MKKIKFSSPIAEAMHETVSGMHRLGLVDKKTMRDFDVRCLTLVEDLTPQDIVAMRQQAGVSQVAFARALNVSIDDVIDLERGDKKPRGALLKLLSVIRRNGFDAIM